MMNYNMLDMLAEDVNTPEIGNPVIWETKRSIKTKMKKLAAGTASAVSMALLTVAALFAR